MNFVTRQHPYRAAAFLLSAALCAASMVRADPVPAIAPVVHLTVPAQAGTTYTLQRSVNLTQWSDTGPRVFGIGNQVAFSCDPVGKAGFLRVRCDTAPPGGLAPWSVSGVQITTSLAGESSQYQFLTSGTGQRIGNGPVAPESFTFTWLRTGENTAVATLNFDSRRESLHFSWTTFGLGLMERSVYTGDILSGTSAGAFLTGASQTALTGGTPFTGRLLLAESAGGDLIMSTPVNGDVTWRMYRGGTDWSCSLEYNGATRVLTVTHPGNVVDTIALTYTSPGTGTFVRQTMKAGAYMDLDSGVFCAVPGN